jgi:hypothetical protein
MDFPLKVTAPLKIAFSERSRLRTAVLASFSLVASCGLAGCGTTVPNIKEVWDRDYPGDPRDSKPTPISGTAQIEYEIKQQIFCDLRKAVHKVNTYTFREGEPGKLKDTGQILPDEWGASISLLLQVDETSGFNPGVGLITPQPTAITTFPGLTAVTSPQSFSLGLGGTLSSTATRIDKFNPYYTIKYLMLTHNEPYYACNYRNYPTADPVANELGKAGLTPAKSSPLITEDDDGLGISEWLEGAMFTNKLIHSVTAASPKVTRAELDRQRRELKSQGYHDGEVSQILASKASTSTGSASGGNNPKPDTVSIEIKFIIVSNGNVTPTWKLVRVSANTGSTPLVNLGRTRTHNLVITIGPATQATQNTFLALENGQTIGANQRSNVASVAPTNNTFPFPFFFP